MFDVGFHGAARAVTRSAQARRLCAVLFTMTAFTILAAFSATGANAAFSVTDWAVTAANPQAGQHSNVNLRVVADPVAGDKTNDDLKSAQIDLPAGLVVNPQAVATACTAGQLSADACPAASQVGKISVQYRVGGSLVTSSGSVYSTTPGSNSAINFGFVVRPTGAIQKFYFSSGATTGLTSVRSGADAPYGLSISIPSIPNRVKTLGIYIPMTIANISIDLFPRSGSTQTGPYFTFNPTRCDSANSRATLVSYKGVSFTKTAAFTPINCDAPRFDTTFAVTASDTTYGASTGISTTVTLPAADQTTQQSELRDISVTLPAGSVLDVNAVNALTAVCSEAQFAATTCPAASQIGTANADTPLLPAEMSGAIYLMSKAPFAFGYVLRGARGATTLLRGSAAPANSAPGGLRVTFPSLPQIPLSSATLNIASKLIKNPTTCQSQFAYGDILGYTGAHAGVNQFYTVTGCPPPPDTTITSGPTDWSRTAITNFEFTSTPAGAAFECAIDTGAFAPCTSPFSSPALSEGWHHFQVRAVGVGGADASPAWRHFQVDTVKPTLTLSTPAEGESISGTSVTANFVAEAGSTVLCSMDLTALNTCRSPKTYTGLASGNHTLLVIAKDAAGNYSLFQPRHFTIAANPVVTISSPTNGTALNYDGFAAEFSATNPNGGVVTFTCQLLDVTNGSDALGEPCESGVTYDSLTPDHEFKLVVEATDETGNSGQASVNVIAGIPLPAPPSTVGGPGGAATTDRTPTFALRSDDALHPQAVFECALTTGAAAPEYSSCGSAPLSSFTPPSDLPNGSYKLWTRSRTSTQVGKAVWNSFSVADWAPTYTAVTSTQQAGAHPDLDIDIKPNAGQLRAVDVLLPKGLIGSLNSFAKCPLEKVKTAYDCPPETQVGTVKTRITITQVTINAVGEVYLTEPQQPGDTAGLTIYVHTPLGDLYENVVIPLRLQLVNNSQYLRTFSDSIPISTPYHANAGDIDANFFVKDFAMHLNGSAGSPFPLLTNPSSCSANQFAASFGDLELHTSATLPIAYQATGCDTVPFSPTLTETYSSTAAGSTSSLKANVTVPTGNSSINTVTVYQPPAASPNYDALGAAGDRCPVGAIPASGAVIFDPTNCPAQAMVGKVSITSPLLPRPIAGKVYLVQRSPLPMFGVDVVDAAFGLKLDFIATNVVDPPLAGCDEAIESCGDRLKTRFYMAPDLPVSTIDMDISGPDRIGLGGRVLPGNILTVAEPDDPSCRNSAFYDSFVEPHSGGPIVHARTPVAFSGCAQ